MAGALFVYLERRVVEVNRQRSRRSAGCRAAAQCRRYQREPDGVHHAQDLEGREQPGLSILGQGRQRSGAARTEPLPYTETVKGAVGESAADPHERHVGRRKGRLDGSRCRGGRRKVPRRWRGPRRQLDQDGLGLRPHPVPGWVQDRRRRPDREDRTAPARSSAGPGATESRAAESR